MTASAIDRSVNPTLDELDMDPALADTLPTPVLAERSAHAEHVAATLRSALLARAAFGREAQGAADPLAGIDVLTTRKLAERWEMPEEKIRELCRSGKLPAKKLGSKEWVISVAALRDWMPRADHRLAPNCHATSYSPPEPSGRASREIAARPYTVVRRPARRPRGNGSPAESPGRCG